MRLGHLPFLLILLTPLTSALCATQPNSPEYTIVIGYSFDDGYNATWLVTTTLQDVTIQENLTNGVTNTTTTLTYPPDSTIQLCRYDNDFTVDATPPRPDPPETQHATYLQQEAYMSADVPASIINTTTTIILTLSAFSTLIVAVIIIRIIKKK